MSIVRFNHSVEHLDIAKNYGLAVGTNVEHEVMTHLMAQTIAFFRQLFNSSNSEKKEMPKSSGLITGSLKEAPADSQSNSCIKLLAFSSVASVLSGNLAPMLVPAVSCIPALAEAREEKRSQGIIQWAPKALSAYIFGKPYVEHYDMSKSLVASLSSERGQARFVGELLVQQVQNPALTALGEAYLIVSKTIPLAHKDPGIARVLLVAKQELSAAISQLQISGAAGMMILLDQDKEIERIVRQIESLVEGSQNPDSEEALKILCQLRDGANLVWSSGLSQVLSGPISDLSKAVANAERIVNAAADQSHTARVKLNEYQKKLTDLNASLNKLEKKEKDLEGKSKIFGDLKSQEWSQRSKDTKSFSVLGFRIASWDEINIPNLGSEEANRDAQEIRADCRRIKSQILSIENQLDEVKKELSDFALSNSQSADAILERVAILIGDAAERVRKTKATLESFDKSLSNSGVLNSKMGGLSSDNSRLDIYAELNNRHNAFAALYFFFGIQEFTGRKFDSILKHRVMKIDSSNISPEERYQQINDINFDHGTLMAISEQGAKKLLLAPSGNSYSDL